MTTLEPKWLGVLREKNVDILRERLQQGLDINERYRPWKDDDSWKTAIAQSIYYGPPGAMELLLAHRADPNAICCVYVWSGGNAEYTPLAACLDTCAKVPLITALLRAGADPTQQVAYQGKPATLARVAELKARSEAWRETLSLAKRRLCCFRAVLIVLGLRRRRDNKTSLFYANPREIVLIVARCLWASRGHNAWDW
jgi:hypothetical protein